MSLTPSGVTIDAAVYRGDIVKYGDPSPFYTFLLSYNLLAMDSTHPPSAVYNDGTPEYADIADGLHLRGNLVPLTFARTLHPNGNLNDIGPITVHREGMTHTPYGEESTKFAFLKSYTLLPMESDHTVSTVVEGSGGVVTGQTITDEDVKVTRGNITPVFAGIDVTQTEETVSLLVATEELAPPAPTIVRQFWG